MLQYSTVIEKTLYSIIYIYSAKKAFKDDIYRITMKEITENEMSALNFKHETVGSGV